MQKLHGVSAGLLAVTVITGFTAGVGPAAAQSGPPGGRPEVSAAAHHDVSRPLRDVKVKPQAARENRAVPNKIPLDMMSRHKPSPAAEDQLARQQGAGPAISATPAPLRTFAGLSADDDAAFAGGRVVPPDTQGDVGPSHYVQAVNSLLAVYDKTTGNRVFGPIPTAALWDGFGGICETNNDGDPIVLYDDAANRWMVSQFAIGADGYECIAVSTTGDPTGSYYRYAFNVSPGTFNDYPKLGVWQDGYYMSANDFDSSFTGVIAVAFERSRMLTGASAQMVKFGPLPCGTECPFALQPSHWEGGTPPPSGAPNTFVMSWDDETWGAGTNPDGYRLWDFSVNWASPGSSTFVALPQVNTAEFDAEFCNFARNCIKQPKPGEGLDVFAQATMFRAQYRNFGTHETIVVNHTVDVTGRSVGGIRWAELRDNGSGWLLHQTGTFAPDSNSRWMGSIAMDGDGNIAIGYSASGSSLFPSIRYATRNASDPLGTMGGEVTLFAGAGSQQSSFNRWGDYSAMSVDPVDDCTFWYTNEYYAATASFDWQTRIGAFKVPGCGGGGGGCTPTQNPETSCSDGVDNDCDGFTDSADTDCQVSCSPAGASCTANSQCCSNSCKGSAANKTCR